EKAPVPPDYSGEAGFPFELRMDFPATFQVTRTTNSIRTVADMVGKCAGLCSHLAACIGMDRRSSPCHCWSFEIQFHNAPTSSARKAHTNLRCDTAPALPRA